MSVLSWFSRFPVEVFLASVIARAYLMPLDLLSYMMVLSGLSAQIIVATVFAMNSASQMFGSPSSFPSTHV
jgi:hypothetical protein